MDAGPQGHLAVVALDILHARLFQHFLRVLLHVDAHFSLVVAKMGINGQHGQTPLIFLVFVEVSVVIVIGQRFAKASQAHCPLARLGEGILEFATDAHFRNFAAPALASGPTLVAKTPDVVALIAKQVAEARHVNAIGAAPVHVFVIEALGIAVGPHPKMMVHDVVPQLAAAAAQAPRPNIGGRVHQHPSRVQRGGVEENDFGAVLDGLVGLGVQHFHTGSSLGVFVVKDFGDDGKWPHREVAGGHRSG